MKYGAFLLILLCSAQMSAQVGYRRPIPQNIEERRAFITNRVAMQRMDRETGVVTYDGYQTFFENQFNAPGKGQISLQPFITLNVITGQSDFHMWVGYRPPYGASGSAPIIKPKYLSILSAKHNLTLPLFYYNVSFPTSDAVLRPGVPSAVQESAYTVLSPEQLSRLMSIAYEGADDQAIEAWEPTATANRLRRQSQRARKEEELPSKRSIEEFVAFQRQQGENASYRNLNWGVFSPPLPVMSDQLALSIVLTGDDAVIDMDIPQSQLTPILEMVDLFYAISNRSVPLP
ncbi:MAG: hypothetical protein ACRCY4_03075 [Brevinema sp.]